MKESPPGKCYSYIKIKILEKVMLFSICNTISFAETQTTMGDKIQIGKRKLGSIRKTENKQHLCLYSSLKGIHTASDIKSFF